MQTWLVDLILAAEFLQHRVFLLWWTLDKPMRRVRFQNACRMCRVLDNKVPEEHRLLFAEQRLNIT